MIFLLLFHCCYWVIFLLLPGTKGGWVTIKDAVKKAAPAGLPLPAAVRSAAPAAEATAEGGEA